MNNQTGRFIDDEYRVIFEQDGKIDRFRNKRQFLIGKLGQNHNFLVAYHSLLSLSRFAIDRHITLFYPSLDTAS